MEKDNIQNLLLKIGRQIVREKGAEALTVRKLSEASGCSVGAIYNQFSNMDNFILVQNYITMENLSQCLAQTPKSDDVYIYLNDILNNFTDFVAENKNLWFLLYNFHMKETSRTYSHVYLRKIVEISKYIRDALEKMLPRMEKPERVLSSQVLLLSLFSVSAFSAKNSLKTFSKAEDSSIFQILFNTYVAGLTVLEQK